MYWINWEWSEWNNDDGESCEDALDILGLGAWMKTS